MTDPRDDDVPVAPGVWECGQCGEPTTDTHFYMDRATGVMQHCADPMWRANRAAQCGWSFYDDYEAPYRCIKSVGHGGHHESSRAHWSEDTRAGAIPPFDTRTQNGSCEALGGEG